MSSEAVVRVVVVSTEPAAVLSILRHKLTGYFPVAVASVEKAAQHLCPGAVILLDLDDDAAGIAAARKLRADGFHQGIVLIGPPAVGGLTDVVGLEPPFQLDDLVAALQRLGRPQDPDAQVGPSRAPAAQTAERDHGAKPIGEITAHSGPPASPSEEAAKPLRRGPTAAVPEVAHRAVASADPSLLTGRQPPHPAAVESTSSAPNAPVRSTLARWRRRLSAPATADPATLSQREMHERLVMMLAAASQLEVIAEEMPVVTDRAALCRAIVEAVADEFEADTVGLWQRDPGGWVVDACYGFTHREALVPAERDQPILQEIDGNGGAILLEPVARFQPLVRGIGGAHTESFMAAAVAVGDRHFGVLALGRDRSLMESDLDRLIEMASEAAVGIGVAEHLERMYALVERSAVRSVDDGTDLERPSDRPADPTADATASSEQPMSPGVGSDETDQDPAGGAVNSSSASTVGGDEPQPGASTGPPHPPGFVIDLSEKAADRR